MLLKRTELGTAELVQSVTPVPFENKVEQSEHEDPQDLEIDKVGHLK